MRNDVRNATARRFPRSDYRAVAIVVVAVLAYLAVRQLTHPSSIDLLVYRAEGEAVWSHTYLYGHLAAPQDLQATYPPFAAAAFVTLIWLPAAWLRWLALAGNLGLLFGVAMQSCRLAGVEVGRRRLAASVLFAAGLWCEPVFTTLRNGQINLLLLALVLWDFTRPTGSRWTGLGVGIAAGLKVTPAIFIGYLLLTRRFRAAATASVTLSATIALSAVVAPRAARTYWTSLLFDSARVGHVEDEGNQSVLGVLTRLQHSAATTTFDNAVVLAILVVGLGCAVFGYRRLGDRWGVPACAVTSLLAAPIAWTHHWVWVVPITVLLWQQARYWLAPALVVYWSYAVWAVPHARVGVELSLSVGQLVISAAYALTGLGFLLLTVHLCRRTAGRTQPSQHAAREWMRAW